MNFDSIRELSRIAVLLVIGLLVAACGEDSDGESDSDASAKSSNGSALSITGSPASQVLVDTTLDFTPSVNNPGGASLTFSVGNLPSWASFDTDNGRIAGTPGPGDVGVYSNITITATGGGESATSPAYRIEVVAVGTGSATLSWIPPVERTDGSFLDNLAGYKVYYGQSQSSLNQNIDISDPAITTYVVENLTPATWYFAATAYDSDGFESKLSNIASKTVN